MINSSSNIILISYPSGGFGNFLYYALSTFARETPKFDNSSFAFSDTGNSHAVVKYGHIFKNVLTRLDKDLDYSKRVLILCDNGIMDDSYNTPLSMFPNATIVRTVIDEQVRPVIYQTCVLKAMENNNLDNAVLDHVIDKWGNSDVSSVRENYTLMYHNWPFLKWQKQDDINIVNVSLKKLILDPYATLVMLFNHLKITCIDYVGLLSYCTEWASANAQFFNIYHAWNIIEHALDNKHIIQLDTRDIHEQGYINYRIEKKYGILIRQNDYSMWFNSTADIFNMLENKLYD